MADFNYTPEIAQVQGITPTTGVKSSVASLATDIGNLLVTKTKADAIRTKQDAKYLDDYNKEQYNEAQLHLLEAQDELYEAYNTTADPEKRNQFVQDYEDKADVISNWYGFEGENATKFTKSHAGVTNKLRLYNSNVLGKANDNINNSTASTADFASMNVIATKDMDPTVINNNKDYLIKTAFHGNKAKYFDDKFSDFGIRLKEAVAETTSPEEIDVLLGNLDIFAKEKLGDTVSVNNKDVTVDSTMYNGYHKNRQFLLEKRAIAVTKLKSALPQHVKGGNKDAYMETVERIDTVGGYENPDLKQSAIDSWDLRAKKANTSKINALKKTPDYVNGYSDPSIIETTYKAHGGTEEQFTLDYKAKHDFTQNFLNTMGNTDLTANPKQAQLVSNDVIKKLVLSNDIVTAVDIAGKTGQGGVIKSYVTDTLGAEDPKTLTANVQKLTEGYYSNQSVMSNNMEKDDKSAMFFYNYQLRTGGKIGEEHIARVKAGNAEGIVQKAGKEFNEEFAGKSNYTENIGIYSALVKYGVPPQTAVDYIKEDTEAHIVNVSSGLFSSMDVDLKGAPNGVQTYDTEQLEDVLSPLIDKVDAIGIEGEKKLVFDKATNDFRLYVNEVPMQDMSVNIDDLVKLKQKQDLAYENTPWAVTSRKIADGFNTLTSFFGTQLRETIENIEAFDREMYLDQAKHATFKVTTNKAIRGANASKVFTEMDEEQLVKQPEYVEEVMKVALNTRENALALFNKDGINEYINFLNTGFSMILAEPLIVSQDGKAIFEKTVTVDVASPDGRKKLETIIKAKQEVSNTIETIAPKATVDFKTRLKNSVSSNLAIIQNDETGGKKYAEGQLHVGQETISKSNPRGTKNTTRYGVVVTNFPKTRGESDEAHATRYYTKNVLPAVMNVKGIEEANDNVITGLSKLVWNKGNIIKNLDLNNPKKTISTLLDVTTTSGKHSNGVINRTIRDYSLLAKELDYPEVSHVTTSTPKNGKYKVTYYDVDGKVIHADSRQTSTAPGSSLKAGRTYPVRNNTIDIRSGVANN